MKLLVFHLAVFILLSVVNCCQGRWKPKCKLFCPKNRCVKAKCETYPRARCRFDKCKCKARFFLGYKEVTQRCSCNDNTPFVCPDGRLPMSCSVPPCSVKKCPKHPNAECVNDHCGGCYARFYRYNIEVTNDCCICEDPPVNNCDKKDQVECGGRICDSRIHYCGNYEKASCAVENCTECRNRWFMPDCTEVTKLCSNRFY